MIPRHGSGSARRRATMSGPASIPSGCSGDCRISTTDSAGEADAVGRDPRAPGHRERADHADHADHAAAEERDPRLTATLRELDDEQPRGDPADQTAEVAAARNAP